MLNGLFILSENGEVLIQKELLSSLRTWKPDLFGKLLRKNKTLPVCVTIHDFYYFHVFCDKVFLVVATEDASASPFIICEYLETLSSIFRDLVGTVNPNALLTNIGLIYEVICETSDAGFPKLADFAKIKPQLCNAVTQPKTNSTDLMSFFPDNIFGVVDKEKRQLSGDASKKPLHNAKQNNEVYVDLVETLSVIINPSGTTDLCNILGKLNVKSYLDGPAEVEIAFPQHKVELSKAVFNPSVSTKGLPQTVKMTVTPGNLEVMRYNVSKLGEDTSLPFTLYANIIPSSNDKMLTVALKMYCGLPMRHPAVKLVGKIPLPESTVNVTAVSSLANVSFHRDELSREFHFTSPLFPGSSHHTIDIKIFISAWMPTILFELTSVALQFEVPMLCHSDMKIAGLKVQALKQLPPGRSISKWIRYLTYSNSFEFRLKDDWYPS